MRQTLGPVAVLVNPDSIWFYRTKVSRDLIARFGAFNSDKIRQPQVTSLVTEYSQKSRWSRRGCYAALRWCLKALNSPPECIALVPSVKSSQARTVTVSDDEFNAVMEKASPAAAFAMLLARLCGLRVGTIIRITPNHYANGKLTVPSKGSTWTDLPVSPRVARLLDGLAAVCTQPSVPYLAQLGVRHRYQVTRRVRAAQVAAGVAGKWTSHDLRRTFARQMYQVTRDIRTVQKAMTHRNPVHTLWYLDNPEAKLTGDEMQSAEPKERRTA